MITQPIFTPAKSGAWKAILDQRLDNIGWGLLLILTGGLWLLPEDLVPRGLWGIGAGVILLGLNAVRYFNRLEINLFSTLLGALVLTAGLVHLFFGVGFSLIAIGLVAIGAYILLKPLANQS